MEWPWNAHEQPWREIQSALTTRVFTCWALDWRSYRIPSNVFFVLASLYHCIVEYIRLKTGKIAVIEFSNTAKEFFKENCLPPEKDHDLAKVNRGSYNLRNEVVYLLLHEHCLDCATVIHRARSQLREKQYCPITNNCEHFSMWCKTVKRFSD